MAERHPWPSGSSPRPRRVRWTASPASLANPPLSNSLCSRSHFRASSRSRPSRTPRSQGQRSPRGVGRAAEPAHRPRAAPYSPPAGSSRTACSRSPRRELPSADREVGRILASRVAVAVRVAAVAGRQLAVCGVVWAGHAFCRLAALAALRRCRCSLARSRERHRIRSREHSGEHVSVWGTTSRRGSGMGFGHIEQSMKLMIPRY